jgi:predicted acylesterase/phospholipase RssA
VPTSVAKSLGADILISLNFTSKPSQKRLLRHNSRKPRFYSAWRGPTMMDVLSKTIYTMQFEIAHARAMASHVNLAPDMSNYNWSDFHKSDEIIKIGEAAMEESLSKVKSFLPFFSDHCRMPLQRMQSKTYY